MSNLLEKINKEKKEMTLGDVVTFHRGYDLPLTEIKPGPYPVVFSNGRRENHAEFKVKGPGVFTGRSGSLGGMFYVEENYWPHNTTLYVSDFHSNDPKYCFYFLSSFDFAKFNAGTGVPTLNRNHIHGIPVKIPDLPIQKKIAGILSAYDAKIENNNLIIRKLEKTAQTLFNEWFVNFRFPGYERVKFVASEVGEIPEGWSIKKISDVTDLNKGISYTSAEINTENRGVALINLGNFLRGGGFNLSGTKYYTGEYKESHTVKPGQILIAMTDLTSNREVIGHPARLPENFKEAVISLDVCSLSPRKNTYIEFLYHLMLRRDFSKLMASCASGTNVSHLSKTHIEGYEFVLPREELLIKFNSAVQPLFSKQALLEEENYMLEQTKVKLLKRLA